jgi:arabinose-5-phosphate isomerase
VNHKSDQCSDFITCLKCAGDAIQRLRSNEDKIPRIVACFAPHKTVYTLGIGKMAFIAGKFAASLRSMGINSHFLDSTHLAHGDLGAVCNGGVVFVFSKSGNSSELKTVIPYFRNHLNTIVLITNNDRSPLASESDITLLLNVEKEGDKLNLMPLASTLAAMALADSIIAVLASHRNFTASQFGGFHPAGQIGTNLNRNLTDINTWKTRRPFIRRNALISEAMQAIGSHLCGLACVVDDDYKLIGVVTDGDLRRALMGSVVNIHGDLESCINFNPTVIESSSRLEDAYRIMESGARKLTAVPVISNSHCLGVMLVHDLF